MYSFLTTDFKLKSTSNATVLLRNDFHERSRFDKSTLVSRQRQPVAQVSSPLPVTLGA